MHMFMRDEEPKFYSIVTKGVKESKCLNFVFILAKMNSCRLSNIINESEITDIFAIIVIPLFFTPSKEYS
jgi:hypothetical protein